MIHGVGAQLQWRVHKLWQSFKLASFFTDNVLDIISSVRNTCREGAFVHAKRPCAPEVGTALLHFVLSTLLPCLCLLLDALHLFQPFPVHSIQVHRLSCLSSTTALTSVPMLHSLRPLHTEFVPQLGLCLVSLLHHPGDCL